ncbi:MAG: hypothetical protein J1E29_00545 [Duncaniella sp.]|nr:hypothetical protein [Duncaniella sp.]
MNKENYRRINEPINSNLYSVQNNEYQWGAVDDNDNVVIEFGKYAWIDGFHNGLAKVIGFEDTGNVIAIHDKNGNFFEGQDVPKHYEHGIINEKGEEVLPLEYNIWKFYGKDFPTIKAFKDGVEHKFYFSQLNPDYIEDDDDDSDNSDNSYYDDYPDYDQMERDTWDAMTDGQYGDMPEGFDGDYSFLGY